MHKIPVEILQEFGCNIEINGVVARHLLSPDRLLLQESDRECMPESKGMPLKCLHFSDAPINDLHNQCYLNGISKNPNGLWFSPFEHDSDGGYTYWKFQNDERALKIDANLNVTLDESETADPLESVFPTHGTVIPSNNRAFGERTFDYPHEITFRDDMKIIALSTIPEIMDFSHFSQARSANALEFTLPIEEIDWAYATQFGQGIFIDPLFPVSISKKDLFNAFRYKWYAQWQEVSGVLWDLNAIESIRYIGDK